MTKQPKENIAPYTKAERRAETEIDRFLSKISPYPARTILDQLKDLA
jgi:hypothetical protein